MVRFTRETDIEHIVARSKAHDRGLCAATRKRFPADLDNLTLASPAVNRCGPGGKCAIRAAEWLPPLNRCRFAARVLAVKRECRLSVDLHEAAALDRILSGCAADDRTIVYATTPPSRPRTHSAPSAGDPFSLYDDNRNARIACAEARRHGIAPVSSDRPASPFMHNASGHGIVCE